MELPGTTLDAIPNLPERGRDSLSAKLAVDSGLEDREGVLHVRALGETSAEEGGVESQQDPAAALENNGPDEKTNPEGDLESGHNGHGRVIVLLDKCANVVGSPEVLDGRLRAVGGGSSGGRDDGGDDGGAGVGREVEDGVDGVGEESQEERGGEEPYKGHDCGIEDMSVGRMEERFRGFRGCRGLTQVLDILIGQQRNEILRGQGQAGLDPRAHDLVDDNCVCDDSRHKGRAIIELGGLGPPVCADP